MKDIEARSAEDRVRIRAMEIWAEREADLPAFARMKWEHGTWAARTATMVQSARDLGYLRP